MGSKQDAPSIFQKIDAFPATFAALSRKTRIFWISAGTIFLFAKLILFFTTAVYPKIQTTLVATDTTESMYNLLFFDVLILIGAVLILLFLMVMFSGRPSKPSLLFRPLKAHPWIGFIIGFVFCLGLLALTPTWIADQIASYSEPIHGLLPNSVYLWQAFGLALCLALFWADLFSSGEKSKWWLGLFLIVPVGPFGAMPLLWGSAFMRWLPSGYWRFWRPVLALCSFSLPVLVFPLAQPIRPIDIRHGLGDGGYQIESAKGGQRIAFKDDCLGYGICVAPNDQSAFLRCNSNLTRIDRRQSGQWMQIATQPIGGPWDEMICDYESKKAMVFSGTENRIYVMNLPDLEVQRSIPISPKDFAKPSPFVKQAYFHKGQILAISNVDGRIASIDSQSGKLVRAVDLPKKDDRSLLWGLAVDPKRSHLLALRTFELSICQLPELELETSIPFDEPVAGMLVDDDQDRVLIAFPRQMKVVSYELETLQKQETWPAPAGVRSLAVDAQNDRLFFAAITGAVEMRELSTGRKLGRVRLVPWIHGMAPVPSKRELIVTSATVPPMTIPYSSFETYDSVTDQLLQWAEALMGKSLPKSQPE